MNVKDTLDRLCRSCEGEKNALNPQPEFVRTRSGNQRAFQPRWRKTPVILLEILLVLCSTASMQARSTPVFPGNFRDRFRLSDAVVSGIVLPTSQTGTQTVNDSEIASKAATHLACVRIDRLFQGNVSTPELQFTWFSPYWQNHSGNYIYAGPPLAAFDVGKRYLIFLKRTGSRWEVAIPFYALEVQLAPRMPRDAGTDLSRLPLAQRYVSVAQELEAAALAQPPPASGTTGMAALTFPWLFDLLGACAQPLYRHFLSVPSPELRNAALSSLKFSESRHSNCNQPVALPQP